jgi:ATP-dependent helicase HepA
MSLNVVGQRCMSEHEPELGLGSVAAIEHARITIHFPATQEQRIYAAGTPVLKRVVFREGESVATRDGVTLVIESIEEENGMLVYLGGGRRVREDEVSDVTSVSLPQERLMAGQVDPCEVFDLRFRALQAQSRFLQSDVRGFLGGRLELIPHQLYILHEVSSRQIPRVLLADEVGLGKTIEACLIVQRLLAVGKARRVLVLVPESLIHQWFVELLRRFNLWFSIFDEERCSASEHSDPGGNPFLDEQLVLCGVSFLSGSEERRSQAIEAGWDMVVVDEAHHLEWTPEKASRDYLMVEKLAQQSPGLLLLTATPTQLGLQGHFARLRLLDSDRYGDYEEFLREAEDFGVIAEIAHRILDEKPLTKKDHSALKRIFNKDPETLENHLLAVAEKKPRARHELIRTLLDQHGTGRVMFRNTRAAMKGFPQRRFCPAPIEGANPTLLTRVAREIEAEETGNESSIRYTFKDDPRIQWLASFLRRHKADKVLLICRFERKVAAIDAALQEHINVKTSVFHEGLPLVQRDRNAAWFAEPDGAQLLLCSEIGSEGRNFQFAHHLILFDLPLNPGLIEQRIGRLDRIGQTETIQVHVPWLVGSAEEAIVRWYHEGLEGFEKPVHGGNEYRAAFRDRLLILALKSAAGNDQKNSTELKEFIGETAKFRHDLNEKMARGRDRLLELNSFDSNVAEHVINRIRTTDTDPLLRRILCDVLDHFGVRITDHEEGDVFLDPSHAYIEGFPSIPHEGMLATLDRKRAIAREDIRFISQDHPLVRDALDLLVNSPTGSTAFGYIEADDPNLLLEVIFVLETVADSRWHVEQFLAPTPLRSVVDIRGQDFTDERTTASIAADIEEAAIQRFLERPGFNVAILKAMLEGATELAEADSAAMKRKAMARARESLGADLQRLLDLKKINDHIRPEEIELATEQLERTTEAIEHARLRLDSIRLIIEGPNKEY